MAGSLKKVGIGADDLTMESDESYPLSTWSRQGSLGTITGLTKMPHVLMTHRASINARYYNSGALTDVTIQAAIDAIGSSDRTIYLEPGTWVLSADITGTDNIYFEFEPGAILQPAAGITFTAYSPENIIASPRQQIIDTTNNSTDPIAFTVASGFAYPNWLIENATPGTTDMKNAFQILDGLGVPVKLLPETYLSTGTITPTASMFGTPNLSIIQHNPTADDTNCITVSSVDDITISGITVKNEETGAGDYYTLRAFYVENSDNVTIENCQAIGAWNSNRQADWVGPTNTDSPMIYNGFVLDIGTTNSTVRGCYAEKNYVAYRHEDNNDCTITGNKS